MLIRMTGTPPTRGLDGHDFSKLTVGTTYQLGTRLADYLIAHGFGEEVPSEQPGAVTAVTRQKP